jgi:hypothetical protein
MVGSVRYAGFQIVCDLDDEVAAAEEQQARAPLRIAAVEAQIEPQAPGIEGDDAIGVG